MSVFANSTCQLSRTGCNWIAVKIVVYQKIISFYQLVLSDKSFRQ